MSELPTTRIALESADGEVYIYDFDELTLEQLNIAVQLFNQHGEMLNSPPKNIDQAMSGGMMDLVLRAISHLIVPADDIGEPTAYKRESSGTSLKYLRSLKSKEYKKVQDIKTDFFSRAGIVDVESLLHFKPMLAAAGLIQSGQIARPFAPAKSADSNSNDSNDSTNQTSGDVE